MTNKQNDENVNAISDDSVEAKPNAVNSDECIRLEGERSPVKNDEKTIDDDFNDYVFTKPHKTKKHKSKSHSQSTPRKKKKRLKKVLLSIGCVLLGLILLVVGTYTYLFIKGSSELFEKDYSITAPQGVETQNQGEFVVYNGKTYEYNKNITSILFMGVDKRELEETEVNGTGGQADVIVLFAVDTKTGKISMINISRDTMTDVTVYSANGGYVGSSRCYRGDHRRIWTGRVLIKAKRLMRCAWAAFRGREGNLA